jgi:threonine dehydrogenase-like Zn-dependent dehydrogenase
VGWHAVGCGLTETTSSALVMGAGAIGLCVTQALRARNIGTIIVADPNTARHSAARIAGATHIISPSTEDVLQTVARICASSDGAHVAFDTAGKQVTLNQCVAAVCVGGTIVNIAVWGGPATMMPNDFLLREKKYQGTSVYTRKDFDAVIEAVAAGKEYYKCPHIVA